MILWLDDIRDPKMFGYFTAQWAKNYDEAIYWLSTGKVTFASLDHDLSIPQTIGLTDDEKTGYDVLCWMEEHNIWPEDGIEVHSSNPSGKQRMLQVVQKHYGELFQFPYQM